VARRPIFMVGGGFLLSGSQFFTLASIACGLSPNITALIASRALQGFGAALLTPASLAMLGATFDEHERSWAIGIWAGAGSLMAAAGPMVGGWLVDHISWSAIFLLNVRNCHGRVGVALRLREPRSAGEATRFEWRGYGRDWPCRDHLESER